MPETLPAFPPDFDGSAGRFAALTRRPLYVLALLTAVFWIAVLVIFVVNVDRLMDGTAAYWVMGDLGVLAVAIAMLYFWSSSTFRVGSRRVRQTGFVDLLPDGAAFLTRHRRRMLVLGALMLGCTFAFAISYTQLVDAAQRSVPDVSVPATLISIATGIASAVGLFGAPFFLAGPWLAVEKLRRTHTVTSR